MWVSHGADSVFRLSKNHRLTFQTFLNVQSIKSHIKNYISLLNPHFATQWDSGKLILKVGNIIKIHFAFSPKKLHSFFSTNFYFILMSSRRRIRNKS